MTQTPFVCTADNPWAPGKENPGQRIQHPDAVEGEQHDGWPAGDYVDFHCPHCGHYWQQELPQ